MFQRLPWGFAVSLAAALAIAPATAPADSLATESKMTSRCEYRQAFDFYKSEFDKQPYDPDNALQMARAVLASLTVYAEPVADLGVVRRALEKALERNPDSTELKVVLASLQDLDPTEAFKRFEERESILSRGRELLAIQAQFPDDPATARKERSAVGFLLAENDESVLADVIHRTWLEGRSIRLRDAANRSLLLVGGRLYQRGIDKEEQPGWLQLEPRIKKKQLAWNAKGIRIARIRNVTSGPSNILKRLDHATPESAGELMLYGSGSLTERELAALLARRINCKRAAGLTYGERALRCALRAVDHDDTTIGFQLESGEHPSVRFSTNDQLFLVVSDPFKTKLHPVRDDKGAEYLQIIEPGWSDDDRLVIDAEELRWTFRRGGMAYHVNMGIRFPPEVVTRHLFQTVGGFDPAEIKKIDVRRRGLTINTTAPSDRPDGRPRRGSVVFTPKTTKIDPERTTAVTRLSMTSALEKATLTGQWLRELRYQHVGNGLWVFPPRSYFADRGTARARADAAQQRGSGSGGSRGGGSRGGGARGGGARGGGARGGGGGGGSGGGGAAAIGPSIYTILRADGVPLGSYYDSEELDDLATTFANDHLLSAFNSAPLPPIRLHALRAARRLTPFFTEELFTPQNDLGSMHVLDYAAVYYAQAKNDAAKQRFHRALAALSDLADLLVEELRDAIDLEVLDIEPNEEDLDYFAYELDEYLQLHRTLLVTQLQSANVLDHIGLTDAARAQRRAASWRALLFAAPVAEAGVKFATAHGFALPTEIQATQKQIGEIIAAVGDTDPPLADWLAEAGGPETSANHDLLARMQKAAPDAKIDRPALTAELLGNSPTLTTWLATMQARVASNDPIPPGSAATHRVVAPLVPVRADDAGGVRKALDWSSLSAKDVITAASTKPENPGQAIAEQTVVAWWTLAHYWRETDRPARARFAFAKAATLHNAAPGSDKLLARWNALAATTALATVVGGYTPGARDSILHYPYDLRRQRRFWRAQWHVADRDGLTAARLADLISDVEVFLDGDLAQRHRAPRRRFWWWDYDPEPELWILAEGDLGRFPDPDLDPPLGEEYYASAGDGEQQEDRTEEKPPPPPRPQRTAGGLIID